MKLNPEIFKAYDIRGIYGEDFDDDMAYMLGRAYVELRKEETDRDNFKFVVASDMRLSSPQLKENLIKGIIDGGAEVIDIDLASTPTFYFAVAYYNYDGGIIVSASHNPKEYNGFKIVREKALPVSKDTGILILKDKILKNHFPKPEQIGVVTKKEGVIEDQINYDLNFAKEKSIKPLKIVVDPANAMGSQYIKELFKHLPCELIKINFKLDGSFPAHEADPFKLENLVQLKEKVLESGADLGIATDGDGDRIFFLDEKGELIEPGITRAILCQLFLQDKPGSKIAYDIRPGKITEDIILEHGGKPIVTKVGHSLIKEHAIKEGAYFAGESSGHFFLNMNIGCFEVPCIVILKLLVAFSEANISVSKFAEPYKRYFHSGEINNKVKNPDEIIEKIKYKYSDGKLTELDIITIEYDDYWFNVRKSNTEPLLRFTLEARSKKIMEEKRDEILKIITE